MSLYLEDIEEFVVQGCASLDCKHEGHDRMFVHARCHLGGRIEVSFKFGDNFLTIACGECHQEIMKIIIASKGREPV